MARSFHQDEYIPTTVEFVKMCVVQLLYFQITKQTLGNIDQKQMPTSPCSATFQCHYHQSTETNVTMFVSFVPRKQLPKYENIKIAIFKMATNCVL